MVFNKKGQSVSEYAIILGLVVAVAAGVTQVLLKGALRDKQTKAISLLANAGNDTAEWRTAAVLSGNNTRIYNQEVRQTKIDAATFRDQKVLHKGGAEEKQMVQTQISNTSAIETIDAND